MTTYAGDPSNFPVDYIIPDDSTPPTASALNIANEALGDRTAWLKAVLSQMGEPIVQATTTTPVTWVAPSNATSIFYEMCGGGGGGAGGLFGAVSLDKSSVGGGGGAGAPILRGRVDIVGGRTYQLFPGAGGTGGAGGVFSGAVYPTNGGIGTQSYIKDTVSGSHIVIALGGGGGFAFGASSGDTADWPPTFSPTYIIVPGGSCREGGVRTTIAVHAFNIGQTFCTAPGDGGDGAGGYLDSLRAAGFVTTRNGMAQDTIAAPGIGGDGGIDDGSQRAGGPGGGGGASLGRGGYGGDGGDAHSGGIGNNGNTDTVVLPTLGGGGGGGGSGGGGATGGNGANGQNGAAGCIRIWVAGVA